MSNQSSQSITSDMEISHNEQAETPQKEAEESVYVDVYPDTKEEQLAWKFNCE